VAQSAKPHKTTIGCIVNAGFQISRTDTRQDGAVSIQIASARAPSLFAWLGSLQQQQIFVDAIKVTTKSDATLAANITLKRDPR
jgi:type II secretory pathway component PulM